MNPTKKFFREAQTSLFGRSYCARDPHSAQPTWGIPLPIKSLAVRDALRRSESYGQWTVVKFRRQSARARRAALRA